jgi:hypothetical protein
VAGSTKGMESNKVNILTTKMNEFFKRNNLHDNFLKMIVASAEREYDVQSSPTEKEISILIKNLKFIWTTEGRLMLDLNASATISYVDRSGTKRNINYDYDYDYAGTAELVDMWIEEQDEFYQSKFNDAYRSLAYQIISSL